MFCAVFLRLTLRIFFLLVTVLSVLRLMATAYLQTFLFVGISNDG